MALTLSSYAMTAGYSLAISHYDLLVGGTNQFYGGFISPRSDATGGFFGTLFQQAIEQSTVLVRALGSDGSMTPVVITNGTTARTRGLLRVNGVNYAAMVEGSGSDQGKKVGVAVLADNGTFSPYDVASLQETGLSLANAFNGYQPSQIVPDPGSNLLYLALGQGSSVSGSIPTRVRIMEIDLSQGQPITPSEWLDVYGAIGVSTIPGFTDSRASRPTSIALSPDGEMLYLAISARTEFKSRILGFRRSDKAKTFDILINEAVNGILCGAGSLEGKLLIKTRVGVDEYDLAGGTSQTIVSGDADETYTYGFSAFGSNLAYFHAIPAPSPATATTRGIYRLTVPGLVGVDPGEGPPDPPDPPNAPTSPAQCEGAQVSLSTDPVTGALSYAFQRNGVEIVSGLLTPQYVDITALIGVAYMYTVTVTTADGTSGPSAVYTRAPCQAPGPDPDPGHCDCCGFDRRPVPVGDFSRRGSTPSTFTRRPARPCSCDE